jgi:hypothetical protein
MVATPFSEMETANKIRRYEETSCRFQKYAGCYLVLVQFPASTLQRHNTENSKFQFICEIFRIGLPILLQENMWTYTWNI